MLVDLWLGFTNWLYVTTYPKQPEPAAASAPALDWQAVLYHGDLRELAPFAITPEAVTQALVPAGITRELAALGDARELAPADVIQELMPAGVISGQSGRWARTATERQLER